MGLKRGWAVVGLALLMGLSGCGGSAGDAGSVSVSKDAASAAVTGSSTSAALRDAGIGAPSSAAPARPAANSSSGAPLGDVIEGRTHDDIRKVEVSPFRSRPSKEAPVARRIALPALDVQNQPPEKATSEGLGAPVRIGYDRKISETAASAQVNALLDWQVSKQGTKVAALRFQTTGARGVRIGLRVDSLPLGAMVRFRADGKDEVYEVAAQEIQAVIQRNLDAGDRSDDARTYWSPNLGGEAITVEFEIPRSASNDSVRVAVPSLSHVFVDTQDLESIQKAAGSCNLDVNCTSAYDDTSRSVARMSYVVPGDGAYLCTGTLLNDAAGSGTPYFLSANHCISSQTVASSLSTYWFYKSASCGSSTLSPAAKQITTGATLLYASNQTDTSFMRLNGAPPAGAYFAASSFGALGMPAAVFGVHNPAGDLQKYSEGITTGATCSTQTGVCTAGASPNFWKVNWNAGTTERGSSGSGLFTRINGSPYLVGQLFGGYASCSDPGANDYYGRFDIAYGNALKQWLSPPLATASSGAIYRFFNTKTGTHFYTISVGERDGIRAGNANFNYEGVGFYAQASQASGNTPVYRFFNTKTGTHFYTISAVERDQVAQNNQFTYEGIAWYVLAAPGNQTSAMYRFFNTETGAHFYTISSIEAQGIQANSPKFRYEGIAYYAWTSPQ